LVVRSSSPRLHADGRCLPDPARSPHRPDRLPDRFRGERHSAASGFSSGQAIRYFANAIDTPHPRRGSHRQLHPQDSHIGDLALTLGYNHNVTRITAIADSPSQLTALNLTLFDRSVQGAIKYSAPQDKLILSQNFSTGKLRVNTRETYYGPFANIATVAASDQFYGAKWVADIDVSYQLTPDFNLAVGANNVFNTYPDKNTVPDTNGFPPYPGQSPFGFYGGYYYARLSYTF
jgi:iron complex outermembrane receptor protein